MSPVKNSVPLCFKNKVYAVYPDFGLVREIEHELGSISALLDHFTCQNWKISELVTLTHMMLQAAGETVDYLSLGNQMLRDGLNRYLASAQSFLQLVLKV